MKTMLALPCMHTVDSMHHGDVICMLLEIGDLREYSAAITEATLIQDARNVLAKHAVENQFDRILWLDSDMRFQKDMVMQMHADMDKGLDMVSAIYTSRKPPIKPLIYSDIGYRDEDGQTIPYAVNMETWPKNQLFEVKAVGFGACMTSVKMVGALLDKYGMPFACAPGFGEDMSFCMRATESGYKIWIDPTITVGHVGKHTYTTGDIE